MDVEETVGCQCPEYHFARASTVLGFVRFSPVSPLHDMN